MHCNVCDKSASLKYARNKRNRVVTTSQLGVEVEEYSWNPYYNTNVIQWDNSRTKQFRLDSFDLMRWNRNHLVWVGLPLRQIRQFQGHLYANTRRTFPHGNDVNEDEDCHYGDLFHPNFHRLPWIFSKGKLSKQIWQKALSQLKGAPLTDFVWQTCRTGRRES